MRFVFLGPPGAGKGTLAVRLAATHALAHIATGDLLRAHVRDETPLGKKAKRYLDKGELVPDDLVIEMVKDRITKPDAAKGFILDGFPRTVNQAESLDHVLSQQKYVLSSVIYFDTSEETIITRLSGRRTCLMCGMSYHVVNIPPKKEGVCDRCGSPLVHRADDKPETIRHRLAVYEKETSPLIQYYSRKGMLRKTSGDYVLEEQLSVLERMFAEQVL